MGRPDTRNAEGRTHYAPRSHATPPLQNCRTGCRTGRPSSFVRANFQVYPDFRLRVCIPRHCVSFRSSSSLNHLSIGPPLLYRWSINRSSRDEQPPKSSDAPSHETSKQRRTRKERERLRKLELTRVRSRAKFAGRGRGRPRKTEAERAEKAAQAAIAKRALA